MSISYEYLFLFSRAYVKSMRLYYAFITGIAGWLGLAFYEHIATNFQTVEVLPPTEKKGLILVLLFLSWGVNQIINDYLGLEEDKINAPERPMVTRALHPQGALTVSFFLMAVTGLITWKYLEPIALIPLIIGVLLNVVYEYAKGYGIWGNIIFGLMITMSSIFGFLAAGPTAPPFFSSSRVSVLILIWVMNGLMTFYTYFKDYTGDMAAGKRTIIVKYGIERSRKIAIVSSFLPSLLFIGIYSNGLIVAPLNKTFVILAFLTLFLQIWTGVLYYRNPQGKTTYDSLATNFRACTCGQATFIALFNTELAMLLFLVSYIFIGFLFNLHTNHRA
ncbi:MAG: UbiA family prenyltransferase [Proteobacteria bacterium]|nr:UbiA family prenyltransferase [Pseudomonadota bacterium]MBU1689071.1 UbiA family prenyltransferase [Pseudomonadota bacterium]